MTELFAVPSVFEFVAGCILMIEQNRQQRDLFESERSFRLLVEGVADYALFMLDPSGIVTSWNIGAQRIKGYTPAEILGQHLARRRMVHRTMRPSRPCKSGRD